MSIIIIVKKYWDGDFFVHYDLKAIEREWILSLLQMWQPWIILCALFAFLLMFHVCNFIFMTSIMLGFPSFFQINCVFTFSLSD